MAGFPRGTTPTLIFKLPFPAENLISTYITFSQARAETLIKHGDDITADGDTLTVRLSQEDTLKFAESPVEIQIRAVDVSGNAIASKIIKADVARTLQRGVIE